MKTCTQCSAPFEPIKSNQRYCGVSCRNKALYERHREAIISRATAHKRAWRDKRLQTIPCGHCGEKFHQKRFGDETCSKKCSIAQWRDKNPELYKAHQKRAYQKSRSTSPWRALVDAAMARAKKRGLPCDITQEWAKETWTGKCEMTGIAFLTGAGRKSRYFSGSIDRKDPKKGYTKDNCRFVLSAVNLFKSDATDEEMFMIAEAIIRAHTYLSGHRQGEPRQNSDA